MNDDQFKLVKVEDQNSNFRIYNPEGFNYVWKDASKIKVPAFRIIGDIYYVGNRDVSSHLITSNEGHILIDTGFSTTVPLLLRSIKKLGFNPKDIKIILNTHGHVDHTGGNRKMIEETGAQVALGEDDVEAVEKDTKYTCAYRLYGIKDYEPFRVDRHLKDGDVVALGNKRVRVYHTPGHTKGTCSFEIEVPYNDEKLIAFLFGGVGQWTFQRMHRSQGYVGDLEDYAQTLTKLKSLKVDISLGSHPDLNKTFEKAKLMKNNLKDNPFIDTSIWKDLLKRLNDDFKKILFQNFRDFLGPTLAS